MPQPPGNEAVSCLMTRQTLSVAACNPCSRLYVVNGRDQQNGSGMLHTTLSRSLLESSSSDVMLSALARAAKASSVGAKTVIADDVESSRLTSPAACTTMTELARQRTHAILCVCSGGDWRYCTLIAAARVCRLSEFAARAYGVEHWLF